MGRFVSASCSCGYEKELSTGCGMLGPESCRHVARCRLCSHVTTVYDDNPDPRCSRCRSRELESLEFIEESEAPVTGLTCPLCRQPTLSLEQTGFWD